MNLFAVLFFTAQHPIAVAPGFAGYLRNARVGPNSPAADSFALVVGRHTGSKYSEVSKEVYMRMVPRAWQQEARAVVLIGGVDLNTVTTFKDAWFSGEDDVVSEAALRHMGNLPPIYTGDLFNYRDPAAPYCLGRQPIPGSEPDRG